MYEETTAIATQLLLEKANAMLKKHDDYFTGLAATDVVQKGNLLVFYGNYFLDEHGLPTAKSTNVFNAFKFLAVKLSAEYHLENARPADQA